MKKYTAESPEVVEAAITWDMSPRMIAFAWNWNSAASSAASKEGVMDMKCDHCKQPVRKENGWWVGKDGTSDCPASERGHEVDGKPR